MRQRVAFGATARNIAKARGDARTWPPRNAGDGRTVRTEHGLEVLDPVALAAQGIALVDCWGGRWEPL